MLKHSIESLDHQSSAWAVWECICRIFTDVSFNQFFDVEMLPWRPVFGQWWPRELIGGRSRPVGRLVKNKCARQ